MSTDGDGVNVKMEGDAAAPKVAMPPNVVSLGDDIVNVGELEKRRLVNIRVTEIIMARLDRDALELEKEAIVGNITLEKRHQLMDLARCLRTTMTWINGPEAEPRPTAPPGADPDSTPAPTPA